MSEILASSQIKDASFKEQSLALFASRICEQTFDGYPSFEQRLRNLGNQVIELGEGSWQVSNDLPPSIEEQAVFEANGLKLDQLGRPLHPWFDDMLNDPDIGVLTGKGFYWRWGPNYTGDPVIIRRDLAEPHVLLIERGDNTGWALPGGFIESGETGTEAALREAAQETHLDFRQLSVHSRLIYQGPVVDLRMTANAWPETTGVHIELPDKLASGFKEMVWEGGDDARTAAWVPVGTLDEYLFGSHLLLIQKAVEP